MMMMMRWEIEQVPSLTPNSEPVPRYLISGLSSCLPCILSYSWPRQWDWVRRTGSWSGTLDLPDEEGPGGAVGSTGDKSYPGNPLPPPFREPSRPRTECPLPIRPHLHSNPPNSGEWADCFKCGTLGSCSRDNWGNDFV